MGSRGCWHPQGRRGGTVPSPGHAVVGHSTRCALPGTVVDVEVTPCPDATSPSLINERNVSEKADVSWFAGTRAREVLSVCWPPSRTPAGSDAWQVCRDLQPAASGWQRAGHGLHITTMIREMAQVPLRAHEQEFLGHTDDLEENSPSQAMVGCWAAASSRTHCQVELSQPSVPGKAQSNAALLPGLSKGLGNFRLKHKNIFKPRYVQSISREGGCKESRERPEE